MRKAHVLSQLSWLNSKTTSDINNRVNGKNLLDVFLKVFFINRILAMLIFLLSLSLYYILNIHILFYNIFFFFFGNSAIWAATFPTIPRRGSSAPMERMLNPLWPRLEPGWRAVQLYLLYYQATSALLTLVNFRNKSINIQIIIKRTDPSDINEIINFQNNYTNITI